MVRTGRYELTGRYLYRSVSHWLTYRMDMPLVGMLMFLCLFGLFLLYSASGQNLGVVYRQSVYLLVGCALMVLMCRFDARVISRTTLLMYLLGLLVLLSVEFAGSTAKGAQRWLDLPYLPRFQPSEIMKWIVPLTVASYLSGHNFPPRIFHVLVVLLMLFVPTFLVVLQPDLGTALLLMTTGLATLFLAGWRWKHMFFLSFVALASLPFIWRFVLYDYQRSRIMVLLFPDADPYGAGWSIAQSKAAIGSGGWFGKGWLDGTQSQLEFLPEGDTDFIVAVLAEEGGLLAVLFLLLVYTVILLRCAHLSLHAPDNFGRLFSGTLTLMFAIFIFVNIGMVSGLLPIVGAPLPLISRGGSSLVSSLVAFGLLMSVCSQEGRISL